MKDFHKKGGCGYKLCPCPLEGIQVLLVCGLSGFLREGSQTQRKRNLEPHSANRGRGSSRQHLPGSSKNLTAAPHVLALSKQQKEVVEAAAAAATANLSPLLRRAVLLS